MHFWNTLNGSPVVYILAQLTEGGSLRSRCAFTDDSNSSDSKDSKFYQVSPI